MSISTLSLTALLRPPPLGVNEIDGVTLCSFPYLASSPSSSYGRFFFLQAAQALEPAALVPLQLLAPGGHVVLVGDPKQLPPTVLSRAAEASNLAQSLFERLQQVGLMILDLGFFVRKKNPRSSEFFQTSSLEC